MKIFVQESCNLFAKKPLARKNWPFSRRCVLCFWENASESDFRCSFFSVEQSEEERTLSLKWQRQTRLCPTVVYFSQRFSKCILQSVFSKYIFQNIFIFKVYFLKALPLKFIFLYFLFQKHSILGVFSQVHFPKYIFQSVFFESTFFEVATRPSKQTLPNKVRKADQRPSTQICILYFHSNFSHMSWVRFKSPSNQICILSFHKIYIFNFSHMSWVPFKRVNSWSILNR